MILTLSLIIAALVALVAFLVYRLDRASRDGVAHMVDLLNRVQLNTNVTIKAVEHGPPSPDPTVRKYISEFPNDDEAWNDFVGAETADES